MEKVGRIRRIFAKENYSKDTFLWAVAILAVFSFAMYGLVYLIYFILLKAGCVASWAQPFYSVLTGPIEVFGDFAESVSFIFLGNPYQDVPMGRTIYLPMCFLILYPFSMISKGYCNAYLSGEKTLADACSDSSFLCAYLLYVFIHLILILLVLWRMSGLKGKRLFLFLFGSAFYGAFVFIFARGNLTFTSFLCVLIFFWLYKKPKAWQRELGYIAFALAISIKVWPVLLAIVFLYEKRYFALVRTACYTLLFVFLPFLLIPGGFSNVSLLIHNMISFNGGQNRHLGMSNVSWDSFYGKIFFLINYLTTYDFSTIRTILSWTSALALTGLVLLFAFRKRKDGDRFPFLAILFVNYFLFPSVNYCYVYSFCLILNAVFLEEFDSMTTNQKSLYGWLLTGIGCPLPYFWDFPLLGFVGTNAMGVFAVRQLFKTHFGKPTVAPNPKTATK